MKTLSGGVRRRRSALIGVAVAALAALTFWPRAEATPPEVERLVAIMSGPAGDSRKAQEIEKLRLIDSGTARNAMLRLADSSDDRVALLAVRALSRCHWKGAADKVEGVYADADRSELVRGAALAAHCVRQKSEAISWSSSRDWIDGHAGASSTLAAQSQALKAKLWPAEVDGE